MGRSWMAAIAAGLAACGGAPRITTSAPAPVTLHACHVEDVDESLLCGTLDVPEDRAHPDARRLALPVIVIPAKAGRGHGTPLFSIAGGPGIAATASAGIYATQLAALREAGDIVLVDQRGTGDGPSALRCPELDGLPPSAHPGVAAVRSCRERLERGNDLRFYGTREVVRDIEDARRALGYDQIDLEALSYGTRVTQVYMRAYPSHVRAVVLFGTVPMDLHLPGGFAETGQRGLDAIVDDCAHDTACAAAYPQLREQLAALARDPLPAGVDRNAFTEWVRHTIANTPGARALPSLVARAATGDFASFLTTKPGPALREAVLLAVTCSEDIPALPVDAASRARATWFGDGRVVEQTAACATWPTVPVSSDTYAAVASDAPVLLFAGARDSITPPDYARRASARIPHATIVTVPWLGHLPVGVTHLDCLDRIELAFLRDPSAQVDTACLADIAPPPFVLPDR